MLGKIIDFAFVTSGALLVFVLVVSIASQGCRRETPKPTKLVERKVVVNYQLLRRKADTLTIECYPPLTMRTGTLIDDSNNAFAYEIQSFSLIK